MVDKKVWKLISCEKFFSKSYVYSLISTADCFYNNVTYQNGDFFPAGDGCNNW